LSDDRKHEKRLMQAQRTWDKYTALYKEGRIDSEGLKEKLRPYKEELVELKLIKGDRKEPAQEEKAAQEAKAPEPTQVTVNVGARSYRRRSTLTIDEIHRRIERLGLTGPSEDLMETYKRRYGEDLPRPSEDVTFEIASRPREEEDRAVDEDPEPERPRREELSERSKGFLKGLFQRNKGG